MSAFQFAAALVILAILAIVQDVTRTPNDQIWIARVLPGSEPTSAQIGRDDQRSLDTSLAYAVSWWFGRSVGAWDPA